jgi:hypothetical protein
MNLEQAYLHAMLSQAAYSVLEATDLRAPDASTYRERLQGIRPSDPSPDPFAFTAESARWFTDTWDVIDIQENDAIGFAGAVYRHRVSGALTVAIRGTDFSDVGYRDLLRADLFEIGLKKS